MVESCLQCAQETALRSILPCSRTHTSEEEVAQKLKEGAFLYDEVLTKDNIRLILIEKGCGNGQIRISFKVTSIANSSHTVEYKALSYTWGTAMSEKDILCNGTPFKVGENLYNALWQIREDGEIGLPWWIDAICINQANILEKNVQVRMMRGIYENASSVLAWIGPGKAEDAIGFALLRTIYDKLGHHVDSIQVDTVVGPRLDTLEQLGLPPMENLQWKAMTDILDREYFYRMWIIQEILVAQQCSIKCGTQSIDRQELFAIGALYELFLQIRNAVHLQLLALRDPENERSDPEPFNPKRFRETVATQKIPQGNRDFRIFPVRDLWLISVNKARQAQDGSRGGSGMSMAFLLNATRQFKAKIPVDKIFALAGLSSDISEGIIDYTKTVAEVQIEVALTSIERPNTWGARLFSEVNASGHSIEIPSWVPDWVGAPIENSSLSAYNRVERYCIGSVWWKVDPNKIMHMPGKIFDAVETIVHQQPYNIVSPYLSRPEIGSRFFLDMKTWYLQCSKLVSEPSAYPTGENKYDVFWRTLVCNREARGTIAAPDDLQLSFIWWLRMLDIGNGFYDVVFSAADRSQGVPDSNSWMPWDIACRNFSSLLGWIRGKWQSIHMVYLACIMPAAAVASQRFEVAFNQFAVGRKFFRSKEGFIGWLPTAAEEGDVLCLFKNYWLPFVIRKGQDGYTLIGEAYVHGVMDKQPDAFLQFPFKDITLL